MSVYVVVRVDGTDDHLEALSKTAATLQASNTWERGPGSVQYTAVAATGVRPSVHAPSVTTDQWRPE